MNKRLVVILILALMLIPMEVNATANDVMKAYDINELDSMPIEATYSYDEVLADMQNQGFSSEEILTTRAKFEELASRSSVQYSKFRLDPYTVPGTNLHYVLQPYVYVGLEYNNSPTPTRIVSIDAPFIATNEGTPCVFGGNIFYRLESGRSFYYGVNGDVYRTGTLTISGGGQIGIGESGNVTLSLSYSNNFIKNVHFDGRYYNPQLD